MRKLIWLIALLPVVGWADKDAVIKNEERQTFFAEQVVYVELTRSLSHIVRTGKDKCGDPCSDTGALELAVGLMGMGRSEHSSKALINLLGMRLDGGGAEERNCQILTQGGSLASELKAMNADDVVSHCKSVFNNLKKRQIANITDVKMDQICHSAVAVEESRSELLKAIGAGERCD